MRNGYFGIWVSLAIIAGIVVAFNLVGGVLVIALYGTDIKNADPTGLLLLNSLSQLAIMLTVPILILRAMQKDVWSDIQLHTTQFRSSPILFIIAALLTFDAQVFGSGIASLWTSFLSLFPDLYSSLRGFQDMMDETMKLVTEAHTPNALLVSLICIALIPAICEETLFRGFIQTNIEKSGKNGSRPFVAILITSLAFGAIHLSPFNLPALAILGAMFGWMVYRTRDLRISMFAHLFNNGLIVVALYLLHGDPSAKNSLVGSSELPIETALMMVAISGALLAVLIYFFHTIVGRSSSNTLPHK